MNAHNTRNTRGTVVIGGTLSDAHVVSIYIASMMLEQNGYDVVNLSCQNETAAFFAESSSLDDLLAVVICNQNGHAREDLADLHRWKRADLPVALAGHYTIGTHDHDSQIAELRALGVDYFLDSLEDLTLFLEQIELMRVNGGLEHAV